MPRPFVVPAPELHEYDHGLVKSANRVSGSQYGFGLGYGGNTFPEGVSNAVEGGEGNRWEDGIVFNSHTPYIINGTCWVCDEVNNKSGLQGCQNGVEFFPYLLEFGLIQATPDTTYEGLKPLAEALMRVGTSAKLEDLTVVGCTGTDNPVLEDGTALAAATSATEAIGTIADYFYDSSLHIGAQGTIYMSPVMFVDLGFDLVSEEDGVLRTKFGGHKVIVGNYPTNKIYAHVGDVDLYLSDVFITESGMSVLSGNQLIYRVERLALVAWDTFTDVEVTVS